MPNTKTHTAIVADRDGNVHRTTRQNLTHCVVSWNWDRTRRVAGWTTKGQAGVDSIISKLVNPDDVEVIELVQVPAVEAKPELPELHGASHTTQTVHLAVVGGYDGKRLLNACGMGRRQTAYLYATDEAVTCQRCLAKGPAEVAELAAANAAAMAANAAAEAAELAAERHQDIAVKQASIGAGKWFVTETVGGTERVVASVYGYATEAEAREVADRMAAPSHLDTELLAKAADIDAELTEAEVARVEQLEAEQIAAEATERREQLEAVRDIYGDAAAWLVENGWTVDSAISHVTGVCDLEVCTGEHGTAWAIMVADAAKRPEAKVAALEAELARANKVVADTQAKLAEALAELPRPEAQAFGRGRGDAALGRCAECGHHHWTGRAYVACPLADEGCACPFAQGDLGECRWFAGCGRQATGTTSHPILGEVPTCDRCAEFAGKR